MDLIGKEDCSQPADHNPQMMSTHDESAMTPPQLTVDTAAGAAYITLNEGRIQRTVPAGDGVLVDFDSEDNVVGVEVLSLTGPPR